MGKTKRLKVYLFLGLLVCFVAIICCMQVAFGNNNASDKVATYIINATDVNEVNDNKASVNDIEQKGEKEMLGKHCLEPWEVKCEKNREGQTKLISPEVEGDDEYTYHVKTKDDNTPNFNILTITRDNQQFSISYDYRGFFGNKAGELGRRANIQYFYNSSTKELHLVCFAGSEIGYNTYGYGSVYWGDTVFEDNIRYDDGTNYDIAENAKSIILDTNISTIKDWGFQCFKHVETIDIIGELYDHSDLVEVCDHVFRKCGYDPDTETNRPVCMEFLHAHSLDREKYLSNKDDWADKTDVVYYPFVRGVVHAKGENLFFYDVNNLKQMLSDFKDESSISVDFMNDLNFYGHTIEIPSNQTLTFNLGSYKLYSYDKKKNKSDTLFKVKGCLNLVGNEENHAIIQETFGSDSTIVIDNGKILANDIDFILSGKDSYPSDGGFFYFNDVDKDSSLRDCRFTGKAKNGGAIYVNDYEKDGATISFTSCEFNNCIAISKGGAIYNDAKHVKLNFNYVHFNSCSSDGHGGAIASVNKYQDFKFDNSSIKDCKTKGQGGFIYSDASYSNYTFSNTKISTCYSDKEGGVVSSLADNVNYNFDNSVVDSCSTNNDGGVLYICSNYCNVSGTISKDIKPLLPFNNLHNTSTFSNCHCASDRFDCNGGGAILTSMKPGCGNHVKISNINFVSNYTTSYHGGGAVQIAGDYNTISGCLFTDNEVKQYTNDDKRLCGGAISLDIFNDCSPKLDFTLKDCEFYNNHAVSDSEISIGQYNKYTKDSINNTFFWKGKHFDREDMCDTGIFPFKNRFKVQFI